MSLMMISRGHRSIVIVDHLHLPDDPGWDTVDVAEQGPIVFPASGHYDVAFAFGH